MNDIGCIFCQIIANKALASKVYEDDTIVAFLDLFPLNPGHTLIVPKYHAATLDELNDATAAHMMIVAKQVMIALMSTYDIHCSGVNLLMANGTSAGQDVFHAHLHVIPRTEKDGIRFGGAIRQRKMLRSDLDKYAELIRNSIR